MRIYIGKIPVDLLTIDEIIAKIQALIQEGSSAYQIVTLNSLMYNHTFTDKEFLLAIQNATLVIPDSAGIVLATWIFSRKKYRTVKRIPGIDLMLKICNIAENKNYKIFLLGARQEIIQQAVVNLKKLFPELNIVGFHHGYFNKNTEENALIEKINNTTPDIIFVGLNVPQQEKWIYRNLHRLKSKIVMGVGGSFDIISGKLRRAPKLICYMYLEWFFRFLQEPWRIKRIINLPVFIYRILMLKMKI